MTRHIPNKSEQMVRYYGYYSNVSRGRRKNHEMDNQIPCILEPVECLKVERPELTSKAFRKNWARLIQPVKKFAALGKSAAGGFKFAENLTTRVKNQC